MAIYTSVLALVLLSTLASARDQFGFFFCGDNQRDKADASVSYATAGGIAELSARFLAGGPYTVIAAAESDESRSFSCITMTPVGNDFGISYYYNGTKKSETMKWDPVTALLKGTITKGLFSSIASDQETKFTVTSYKDGYVALKTCKNGFFSHFVATYVMVDKTVDKSTLNMDCLGPINDEKYRIQSWVKGICA